MPAGPVQAVPPPPPAATEPKQVLHPTPPPEPRPVRGPLAVLWRDYNSQAALRASAGLQVPGGRARFGGCTVFWSRNGFEPSVFSKVCQWPRHDLGIYQECEVPPISIGICIFGGSYPAGLRDDSRLYA